LWQPNWSRRFQGTLIVCAVVKKQVDLL